MRHRRNTTKLKRTASHRRSLLANLAGSLIEHGRIKTTLGKAKALRPVVEKLVTLAKKDDLHARRQAIAFLYQKDLVKKLFAEVGPAAKERQGGYTRITKLGVRPSDAAPMAIIEWVDQVEKAEEAPAAAVEEKAAEEAPKAKKTAKKKAEKAEAAEETPAAE